MIRAFHGVLRLACICLILDKSPSDHDWMDKSPWKPQVKTCGWFTVSCGISRCLVHDEDIYGATLKTPWTT